MRRVIPLVLSLLLMIGEGLTFTTSAATSTSHSARLCNYCKGEVIYCTGKPTISKTSSIPEDAKDDNWMTFCGECGDFDGPFYLFKANCSRCSYYKITGKEYSEDVYSSHAYCSSCISKGMKYGPKYYKDPDSVDMTIGGGMDQVVSEYADLRYYVENEPHPKMSSSGVISYNACSHGLKTGPHYYACSSHSSYGTTKHYYCTTHGYVGTSSICPGLAVTPTPTNMSVYYGQKQQITANQQPTTATVTYSSSDTTVATVSSTGLVESKKKGSTTITVTATL